MAWQKPKKRGMGSNINFNNATVNGTGDEEKKAGEDLGSSVRPAKEVYAGIRYSFAKEYLDEKRREFLESKDKEFEEIAIKVKAGEKANDGDKLREGEVPPENTAPKVENFQQEENLTKLDLEELKKRISSLDNDIEELELEIEELIEELKRTKEEKEEIESNLKRKPKKKSQSKSTIGDREGVIEEEYKNKLNETEREINKKEGVLSEKKKEKEEIRAEVERRTKTKSADEKGKKTSDTPDMIVREEEKHPADAGATKPQSSNRGIKVEKTGEEEGKSSATASGVPTPSDGFVSEIFEKIKAGIRELSVEELRELSVDELSKIKLRLEKRIRELANKNKTLPKEKIEGKGKIKEPEKGEIENNRGEQDSKQKPNKIEETDQETRNNREELEKLNIAHMAISNILLEKYKTQETQEKREEAARALGIGDRGIRNDQIENIISGGSGSTVGKNTEGSDKNATGSPVQEEGKPHVPTEAPVPTEPPVLGGSASIVLGERVVRKGLTPAVGSDSGAEERVADLNTEKPGEAVQTEEAASAPVVEAPATGSDGGLGASADDTNSETETNKELSLEEWQIVWENDKKLVEEIEEIIKSIDKNKEPERYRENCKVAALLCRIVIWDEIMRANEIDSDGFNKAMSERAKNIDEIEKILYSASAESDSGAEERTPEAGRSEVPDAEGVAVRGSETGKNATGDEESDRTANADGQREETSDGADESASEEEEKPAADQSGETAARSEEAVQTERAASEPVQEEGKPPVPTEPPVLGGSASEVLRKRVVREGLNPKDGTPVDEAAAVGSDSGAAVRTPKTVRPKESDAEDVAVRGSETGEKVTGDEEKAETEKPAKKTEAEILYQKDLYKLKEKEDILKYWENVQAVWQADYNAATRKVRDRAKRARCSYEILKAEAQKVRASKEIERLKEIVGVSAKMVDAEKEFGADSEQYIEAKNERERRYKLYEKYVESVGEARKVGDKQKGTIKKDQGAERGGKSANLLKPAKPSKLKAFWNKIKKSLGIFVAVAVIGATIATGVAHGTKYLGKVDDPNTNPPIEQPWDDSKDNELVEIVDKEIDTDSLTDEDKQQIEDELEQAGSITSMVKIDGVEGISYREDGDVDKVNIYITTQAGSIIEYQTQVTKDEISELATTEGVTAKDVVDLILSDVSKSTPSVPYKKIDETKYSQLISNIYSDAEDIEFPEPGKYGNYTSFYFKIDNTRNEKGEDVGNVDFLAIGPDSVVKVDDRVEYTTLPGEKLNLRDPSALLNMIERSLGGNASTSGFSGEIETKFNSTSYFQTHKDENSQVEEKDENSQVEEAEAIQNIMDEAVAKTEEELSNDELTR